MSEPLTPDFLGRMAEKINANTEAINETSDIPAPYPVHCCIGINLGIDCPTGKITIVQGYAVCPEHSTLMDVKASLRAIIDRARQETRQGFGGHFT